MTVLRDPVKNLAKIADFDGSGYLEVWTSIRDGGADGILTDTPVHTPITSTGIETPDLIPGPAYYRLKLGALRQSIEGRCIIPTSGPARVMDVIASSILVPEDTPAELVVQAVQAYLAANPPSGGGGGLTKEEADQSYAPAWVVEAMGNSFNNAFGAIDQNMVYALAAHGDSLTWGKTFSEFSYPELVSDYLDIPLYNSAVPGETPVNIACRIGALRPKLSVPGGTLPADASRVAATLTSGETFKAGSDAAPNIGSFTGRYRGVDVTLRFRETGGWTIARAAAGSAVAIPTGSWEFVSSENKGHRGDIALFWAGRNNINDLVAWTQKMVDHMVGFTPRFLVLSVITGAGEGTGNTGHTAIVAANAALAAAFPDNYIDIRRHLIDNGLAQAGIAPTSQDTADIAADTVPASLRGDQIHLNAAANRVVARKVAERIIAQKWAPDVPLPPLEPGGSTGQPIQGLRINGGGDLAYRTTPAALRTAQKFSVRMIFQPTALGNGKVFGRISSTVDDGVWQVQMIDSQFAIFQGAAASGFGGASKTYYQNPSNTSLLPVGQTVGFRVDFDGAAGSVDFLTSQDGGATWTSSWLDNSRGAVTLWDANYPLRIGGGGFTGIVKKFEVIDGSTVYVRRDFTVVDATEDAAWSYSGASVS